MSESEPLCLIDGERGNTLAVSDRALHYGDGVFETLAIIRGRPQLWSAHMERLLRGCALLGLPAPDLQALAAECETLCQDAEQAVCKIIVTRGSGGRGYRAPASPQPHRILIRYPWPQQVDAQNGLHLTLCHTPLSCHPQLSGIKHLNRLEQVLARNEWQDDAFDEGLMCDPQGYLVEGTMSNLFAIRQAALLTPDLSHCGLPGIMRQQVFALAEQRGISCQHVRFRPEDLEQVDEIFICNSLLGIAPVSRFADRDYPIEQGLAWREAMQAWLET